MSSDREFIEKLNKHWGTPKDVAIDTFKKVSDGKGLIEAGGMAICAKKFPEIPVYAGLTGAGAGILVTLLLVFIYNTFTRRRRAKVSASKNETTAQ